MPVRADLHSLTAAQRQALVNLMLGYLNDAVVAQHTTITHDDVHIFTGHRDYIEELEAYLLDQGAADFVPLPKWDPATPIPPQFNVVKARDNGTARQALVNLNPNRPKPSQFGAANVCSFTDGDSLGDAVNPWHGGVHVAVGGTMADFAQASAAPIFWCWHAYVDGIYDDWLACQAARVGWVSKGGVITSDPAVAQNPDGRLEVFARGASNALYHLWQTAPNNGWSGWASLGGVITSPPVVGQNADGRLAVFARGARNALYLISQTAPNNGWSGWVGLGGVITSPPAVARNADGRLEVFARGLSNRLFHISQTAPSGGWSGWASLDGTITSVPAVGRNADGRLEVFARGASNALYHIWQTAPNGGWSGWASLGGVITTDPVVARNADGRLEVFARGTNNALYRISQTAANGGWSSWASLGGRFAGHPAVARNADGRLEAFGAGMDNAVWHRWQTAPNGGWSADWVRLGSRVTGEPLTGGPAVGRNDDGRLEVFIRGDLNDLEHRWQVGPGGLWN